MKKFLFLLTFVLFLLPAIASAHSGNTNSYGCHTCYTNCSLYGLSYGEYHCHNSTVAPVAPCYSPVSPGCDLDQMRAMNARSGLLGSDFSNSQLAQCQQQIDAYNLKVQQYNTCYSDWLNRLAGNTTQPAITAPVATLTGTELCRSKHGQYSFYNETLKTCGCNDNYAPSNSTVYQCIDITAYCKEGLGLSAQAKVYKYVSGGYAANCKCQEPLILNSTNTACVLPTITLSTTNLFQRPSTTVIIPAVINSYTGMYGRTVYTDRPDPLKIVGAMVKGETDPATYIVDTDGKLRWIKTEAVAKRLFGTNWDSYITWFNDSIIYTYYFGDTINE